MGNGIASDLAYQCEEGLLSLDLALGYHLECNHFPPLPSELIPTCKEAIIACNDGDYERLIDLPDGILFRGEAQVYAYRVVQSCHLEYFLVDE
jgi:hypothetical protein